jgi:hypothetical protein
VRAICPNPVLGHEQYLLPDYRFIERDFWLWFSTAKRRPKIARSFNCGIHGQNVIESRQGRPDCLKRSSAAPPGLEIVLLPNPQLKLRAIFKRAFGAFQRRSPNTITNRPVILR